MEKLGQLRASGEWDLVVVDTPPTRSALDFLDAPARLGTFLDGRLIKVLTAPARAGGRAYLKVVSAGVGMVTGVINTHHRRPGAARRADLRGGPGDDVRRLPRAGRRHLRAAQGARDRVRGGGGARAGRPARGGVLRRAPRRGGDAAGRAGAQPGAPQRRRRAHRRGVGGGGPAARGRRAASPLTAGVLRLHGERVALRRASSGCASTSPARTRACAVVEVAALAGDVHDLDGLRGIGTDLAPAGCGGRPGLSQDGRRTAAGSAGGGGLGSAAAARCRGARRPSAPAPRARGGRCRAARRQEVTFGRRRSSARRSRSVIPPQTPNSTRASRASARHSVRTGQPWQISLAWFCAAPWTKSSSGSAVRQQPGGGPLGVEEREPGRRGGRARGAGLCSVWTLIGYLVSSPSAGAAAGWAPRGVVAAARSNVRTGRGGRQGTIGPSSVTRCSHSATRTAQRVLAPGPRRTDPGRPVATVP